MPSFAVIGGEGFVGHAIVLALSIKYPNSTILSLDLVQRHFPTSEKANNNKWTFQAVDLCSLPSLLSVLQDYKVDTVLHTASPWAGSGKAVCEKVNVEGTATVIKACVESGSVKKLVYTSSAGIAFEMKDLVNVDERLEPPAKAIDPYNDTKARAEALVLEANGQNGLLTCAIRPAGIFGPGDRQAIPGFIAAYKAGKHKISIGSGLNLFDTTHIDNVVHAHLLAVEKLTESVNVSVFETRIKPTTTTLATRPLPTSLTTTPPAQWSELEKGLANDSEVDTPLPSNRNRFDQWFDYERLAHATGGELLLPIAGQAFYVSNGEPIPFWSWARIIWYEYAGHSKAMWNLSEDIGMAYATIENAICGLLGKKSAIPKTSVAYSFARRYYSIEKARRMLGYEPLVGLEQGLKDGVRWYKENEKAIDDANRAVVSGKDKKV